MVEINELKNQFRVRNLDPYGDVVIVPHNAFQHHWEKDLEAQGYRVFSNEYEGRQAFFIRLLKGKPKQRPQTQVVAAVRPQVFQTPEPETKFSKVPISLLESNPEAVRETYDDLESLAATIQKHGLLEPLIVTPHKEKNAYQVVAGERRLRAARKAGLQSVPCIIFESMTPEQLKELQVVENIQRKELRVYEELKVIEALHNHGLSVREIGAACGLSHGRVTEYLTIAKSLPVEVQRRIERGSTDPRALTLAKALVLAKNSTRAQRFCKRVFRLS